MNDEEHHVYFSQNAEYKSILDIASITTLRVGLLKWDENTSDIDSCIMLGNPQVAIVLRVW